VFLFEFVPRIFFFFFQKKFFQKLALQHRDEQELRIHDQQHNITIVASGNRTVGKRVGIPDQQEQTENSMEHNKSATRLLIR
jgi:hypothetical protein